MESFGEPDGDGLMNGFTGKIGVRWMVFDDNQRWVFHKIASTQRYANQGREYEKADTYVSAFYHMIFDKHNR